MPCLLIKNTKLVKTIKFKNPAYVGDPVNAIKIFNEKEVDELLVMDISDKRALQGPDYQFIKTIAEECFMPVCYGGGITGIDQIKKILQIGIEKVSINSALLYNKTLVSQASGLFGSQCIVVALDIKKNWLGKYQICFDSGSKYLKTELGDYVQEMESLGAGELLINNIDREGTWNGFDIELIKLITSAVRIPVIAMGGAGKYDHIRDAIGPGKASAVAIGSMAVYQNKGMGVLVNFPKKEFLNEINSYKIN